MDGISALVRVTLGNTLVHCEATARSQECEFPWEAPIRIWLAGWCLTLDAQLPGLMGEKILLNLGLCGRAT